MTKIKRYDDITVKLIRSTSYPLDIINTSANITMKKNFQDLSYHGIKKKIKFLLDANHTSVFEHISYTFLIIGASRSFLAQMTRHRMASYTSGSQHYQNYSEYGFRISKEFSKNRILKNHIKNMIIAYNKLIKAGMPHHEARQLLPNGMENNLMITINARSLINFLNLRLCSRNTEEIKIVADKVYKLVNEHFPELFDHIGPDCFTRRCRQGKMSCGIKWKP